MEYRYGADGERAVKYGSNGNQTLYFNGMVEVSRHHNLEWVESKHIYVGDTRIATKRRHEGNDNYGEEERSVYYYHEDHLGSAQLVTDYRGEVYEHLEYTPYGELWVEEVRAGEEKTPFRFTGKRLDEETGLYYYGARYLDPQTSRWLSTDPAVGEYIPSAPVNEAARNRNGNLPGMGGVFNYVNLHVSHYAGNNPVKLTDPDGRIDRVRHEVGEQGPQNRVTPPRITLRWNISRPLRIPDISLPLLSGMKGRNLRNNAWDIYAIKASTVFAVTKDGESVYGNSVIIRDNDGVFARYAHLENLNFAVGDTVSEGQVIGTMGKTGRGIPSPNKHLHVSVYPAGTQSFYSVNATVDPGEYITGGTYPSNTYVSTGFQQMIGNPEYAHEGLDFSGLDSNLINGWERGISGRAGITENLNR
jgi:RHS repeat-associated protein